MGERKKRPSGRSTPEKDSLGAALNTFLRSSGLSAIVKYPQLAKAWERAAGPDVASRARFLGFRNGVMDIAVDSSALMTEIEFKRQDMLRSLQQEVKNPFIAKLSFLHRPMQEDHG